MVELIENKNEEKEFDGLKLRALNKSKNLKLFEDFSPNFSKESQHAALVKISNAKHFAVIGFDKTFVIATTHDFS
ncbi:hypothetical protein DSO57_1011520 [Entomophthora muscae]|uniref:Uncharacterized protein n=2 Tax=Entomophthora muscae TaxID=34485 RepID=A0ACC2RPZ2_9FUNG|nr:hypothetical protein DSO57_1037283 [Entomophthora muscae]KAJ9062385.1 hypothetical protein DSO57_1011520 [Entomophthora muscae]